MADAIRPDQSTEQELVIKRVFDAPRELVWKAWTEPEHIDALVGAEGLHDACLQDRSPRGRRVPLLHAIARGPGLLEHGRLSRNRSAGAHRLHGFVRG